MSTVRWTMTDLVAAETVTVPQNPITMDPLPLVRTLTTAYPTRNTQDRPRSFPGPRQAQNISWSGGIRTEAHWRLMRAWCRKTGVIRITDHMGRTFDVLMVSFKPERKAGRRPGDYRMRYTATAQFLRRIA